MSEPSQPHAHAPDAAAIAADHDDASTPAPDRAPAVQAPTEPIAPVDRKTAPARSALIAGAAGLAIVAGALGFGAGYITGDTTSERPTPAAVWQQGGNGPGMGGGPQMGGPQMNGPQMGQPGMGGLPGRQNQDGESDSESDDQDGRNTSPGSPTQQQGQADTGA